MHGCNNNFWWLDNPCNWTWLVQHLESSKCQGASLKFPSIPSSFFYLQELYLLNSFDLFFQSSKAFLSFISSCSFFICHASFIYSSCLLFSFFKKFLFLLKPHPDMYHTLFTCWPRFSMGQNLLRHIYTHTCQDEALNGRWNFWRKRI